MPTIASERGGTIDETLCPNGHPNPAENDFCARCGVEMPEPLAAFDWARRAYSQKSDEEGFEESEDLRRSLWDDLPKLIIQGALIGVPVGFLLYWLSNRNSTSATSTATSSIHGTSHVGVIVIVIAVVGLLVGIVFFTVASVREPVSLETRPRSRLTSTTGAIVAVLLVVGGVAWLISRSTHGSSVTISGTVTHEFVSPGSALGTALGYGSGQATCGTKAALGSLDVGDQTILVKDASGTIVGQAKTGPSTCAPSQSKSGGVSFKGVVVSAAFSVSVPRSGFYTFSLPPAQDVTVSLSQASQGVKIDTGIG